MNARRRPAVLGVAVGGVLAGHWLTYQAVSPTPHAREALLHDTGHAYLGLANDIGLLVVLAAFAAIFLGRLTTTGLDTGPTITRRIVGFQVGAFLAMEVLERVTAGAPLTELAHHLLLPTGIAVQIGVGLLAAAVIRWLLRLADRVASAIAPGAAAPAPLGAGVRASHGRVRPDRTRAVRDRRSRSSDRSLTDQALAPAGAIIRRRKELHPCVSPRSSRSLPSWRQPLLTFVPRLASAHTERDRGTPRAGDRVPR